MIDLMDKNGRIIRLQCSFYGGTGTQSTSFRSADEVVQALLALAPASEFLRGPHLSLPAEEKKK